jgi:hypothetical protein
MKIIKNVTYQDVLSAFKKEHEIELGTNSWAVETITTANNQCEGSWLYVELEPREILSIFLPWHEFDCQTSPIIPRNTKMNVITTTKKIKLDKDYASKNPDCWAKIDYNSRQEKILPIFISTKPIQTIPEYDAYFDLIDKKGNLFHLDGFHRLVSWCIKNEMRTINAYVAEVK